MENLALSQNFSFLDIESLRVVLYLPLLEPTLPSLEAEIGKNNTARPQQRRADSALRSYVLRGIVQEASEGTTKDNPTDMFACSRTIGVFPST